MLQKPMALSPALSELLGETQVSFELNLLLCSSMLTLF